MASTSPHPQSSEVMVGGISPGTPQDLVELIGAIGN